MKRGFDLKLESYLIYAAKPDYWQTAIEMAFRHSDPVGGSLLLGFEEVL
jgi:hypothetical protein